MKTKILFFAIALISVVVIFSSCESKSGKRVREMKNNSKTIQIPQHEYDSLKKEVYYTQFLEEELKRKENFIGNLKQNPQFFLCVLDAELSATEKGQDSYGSFSDFFIPTIHEALKAGVSRLEIQKRINKLTELANKGSFLSSYEEKLFKEGGIKAIIEAIGLDK